MLRQGYPKELEEKRDVACKAKDAKSRGTLASIAHRQKTMKSRLITQKRAAMPEKTILLVSFLPICIITVRA